MTSSAETQTLALKDKVAIVTGSSRGLGVGFALELARRGAKITVVYTSPRSETLARDVVHQIEALGSRAIAIRADLSQFDAGDRIVSATLAAFGSSIDILVNNAAQELNKPLLDITPEDFAKIYDVNVRGALLLTKAVVPHLRAPGRIINISSVGSRKAFPQLSLYCSSKAALEGITRCLAAELGEAGHTVNAVLPGPVESDMLDNIPKQLIEMQKRTTPVEHRLGRIDEVAKVVAWLAGEDSGWVSGQSISTSGGYLTL